MIRDLYGIEEKFKKRKRAYVPYNPMAPGDSNAEPSLMFAQAGNLVDLAEMAWLINRVHNLEKGVQEALSNDDMNMYRTQLEYLL